MQHSINKARFFLSFLFSLCITGLGRPSDVTILSFLAATMGYVPFWNALLDQPISKKKKYYFLWALYFGAALLQTRWLLSHPFDYIIGIWLALALILSIPYALITTAYLTSTRTIYSLLSFSTLFALVDMCEPHYLWVGISFRSIGTFWMGDHFTQELITLLGGTGLTFFVILMNGAMLSLLRTSRTLVPVYSVLILPIACGLCIHETLPSITKKTPIKVAVFHFNEPAIMFETYDTAMSKYYKVMERLFSFVPTLKQQEPNVVVLPEGMIPFAPETQLIARAELPKDLWQHVHNRDLFVQTKDIAQSLVDALHTSLLIGLERREFSEIYGKPFIYNSGFLFSPHEDPQVYDKRALVPGGEFIPYEAVMKPILSHYGITTSFQRGDRATIFRLPQGTLFPLICYDETLTTNILPATELPTDLVVSISNDHWFPTNHFAREHWLLGKMRAMESGFSLVRSTNMGISGVILADGTELLTNSPSAEVELLVSTIYPKKRFTPFAYLKESYVALLLGLIFISAEIFDRKRVRKGVSQKAPSNDEQ